MNNAIQVVIPQGQSFEPEAVEDAFARYFRGMADGSVQDTDVISFIVRPSDPLLPNCQFTFVPLMYMGYEGSFPDVDSLRDEEEEGIDATALA